MAINVLPIRRDIKFSLPKDRALDWHRTGVHVSQFLNTMSLFFPVGERFFIDSVRAFRDQVDDPELKKAITAFIGQEAMHGREHDELNDILHELDIPVKAQERTVTRLLNLIQKTTPKAFQLSATVALEHLTAIMGDAVLRQAIKPWLDWFKPGFHPWDHDNRHFLESLDDLLGAVLEKEAA